MKRFISFAATLTLLGILVLGCGEQSGWKSKWDKYGSKLMELNKSVLTAGPTKVVSGNHKYPDTYGPELDKGYFVLWSNRSIGNRLCVNTYYLSLDTGQHFEAFIFTNDDTKRADIEKGVKENKENAVVDKDWYYVKQ